MWQTFTDQSRAVVYFAQTAALSLSQTQVDTEHFLLGILRQPNSSAYRLLIRLGCSPRQVRAELLPLLRRGTELPSQERELAAGGKRIINLSYDEARQQGKGFIGPEHLLLGLIRDDAGLAGRVLRAQGASLERARAEVKHVQNLPTVTPAPNQASSEQVLWQRFTERARRTVFLAQEEAERLGECAVSTEHLLLGLLKAQEPAPLRYLSRHGIEAEQLRSRIQQQLVQGAPPRVAGLRLAPRAKRAIDLAYDEAQQVRSSFIGPEHLFLGLIREGEGLAGRVLAAAGVSLETARTQLLPAATEPEGTP